MTFKKENVPWNKGKHGCYSEKYIKKLSEEHSGEKNFWFGKHHTEETRKKISEGNKGRIVTEETRKKIGLSRKGKQHTEESKNKMRISALKYFENGMPEETRKKIGVALKGVKKKPITEEHKKNLSKALSGEKNPFYGKHHTEETKRKLSESLKGNTRNKGKYHTEGTKQRIRLAKKGQLLGEKNPFYGKHHTEETKNKLRDANTDWDFYNEHGCLKHNYPYSDCFTEEFKDMIRAGDGNKCVVTGMTNEEHKVKYGRSLTVHHWTYDKDVTDPFYFVTVTCGINIAAETNRGEWIDMFNGIMEDKYCELMQ